MPAPHGLACERHDGGTVTVTRRGRPAAALRGERARRFPAEAAPGRSRAIRGR